MTKHSCIFSSLQHHLSGTCSVLGIEVSTWGEVQRGLQSCWRDWNIKHKLPWRDSCRLVPRATQQRGKEPEEFIIIQSNFHSTNSGHSGYHVPVSTMTSYMAHYPTTTQKDQVTFHRGKAIQPACQLLEKGDRNSSCSLSESHRLSIRVPAGRNKIIPRVNERQLIIQELLKLWAGLRETRRDGEGWA